MEAGELAARLLRRHWIIILICTALPVLSIALITLRQPAMYAADARIITGSTVPASSTVADATVGQVQSLATSRSEVAQALRTADAKRNLDQFIANNISVTGLGGSQVVDLAVTDPSPVVAEKVAAALASEVTASLNNVGESGLKAALQAIGRQIVRLSQQRASIAAQAAAHPKSQQLQAKLAGLDEVIANYTGDRGRLLIQAGSQGRAMVVDKPVRPAAQAPNALPQKMGLALLLGLVAGMLIAAVTDTLRPTVPGARQVSLRLGAPLLGRVGAEDLRAEGAPDLDQLALRLGLAATHAGVSVVALASLGADIALDEVVAALLWARPGDFVSGRDGSDGAHADNSAPAAAARADATGMSSGGPPQNGQRAQKRAALRICALDRMDVVGKTRQGSIGLLILTGPSARLVDVTELSDLAASFSWPVLGVADISAARFGWFAQRLWPGPLAAEPARHSLNGAGAGEYAEQESQ